MKMPPGHDKPTCAVTVPRPNFRSGRKTSTLIVKRLAVDAKLKSIFLAPLSGEQGAASKVFVSEGVAGGSTTQSKIFGDPGSE